MKTVEEKAIEYTDNEFAILPKSMAKEDMRHRAQKDFEAGYNEAMRWRDPEVELPEFNKEDYLNGDYKKYLIRVVKGSISKQRYVTVGWLVSANRWNVEMDWVNVIGWKPIE